MRRRVNKYKNKKTEIDGVKFDSKAEGRRYKELLLMVKAGEISDLKLQPRFTLQEAYEINGRKVRKIEYVADFIYNDKDGNMVIEDVKGVLTDVYKLKKKLFEFKYKMEIREVKY